MPSLSLSNSGPWLERAFNSLDWRCGALLVVLSLTLACGSGGTMNSIMQVPQAPSITAQPANQSTRVGQSATFKVVASGTTPLSYQWSKNGTTISGATSASYTTAPALPSDNGASFTVTVTNAVKSVKSAAASLTVGPRAPKAGDLRFQQVDASSTISGLVAGGIASDVNAGVGQGFGNSIGTPLAMGNDCGPVVGSPYNCAWFFVSLPLP